MKNKFRLVVVVLLMIAASVYINVVLSHGEIIPITKSLSILPKTIGEWTKGRNHTLDKKTLDILRVDDYVMTRYTRADGRKVLFYTGYFKSQREGQIVHSPKHCLPGSGWRPISTEVISIDIPGFAGSPIKATKIITQKGEEKELVIYWYQVGPNYVAGEYSQKFLLIWNSIRHNRSDGSLIRFSVPVENGSVEDTRKMTEGFIREMVPVLRGYLPV
ncbi:EpsI protein [hydrothermal vent metagenome]|uniref:EpsI protein n=1 Tax=hydrothermal vent metagenome TaxID=652676 RepID=A0A3B0R9J1_9ZZZZ